MKLETECKIYIECFATYGKQYHESLKRLVNFKHFVCAFIVNSMLNTIISFLKSCEQLNTTQGKLPEYGPASLHINTKIDIN